MSKWTGFKFTSGFFIIWSPEGKMRFGKCDPLTKKVIEW